MDVVDGIIEELMVAMSVGQSLGMNLCPSCLRLTCLLPMSSPFSHSSCCLCLALPGSIDE